MGEVARELRDFVFKGLLFDAECEQFRDAGVSVGIPADEAEQDLLRESISSFGLSLRAPALRMARLYAVIFCFENSVRELIAAKLLENKGGNWWEDCVPPKVRQFAESRKEGAEKNSWLEGAPSPLLNYVDFGQLSDIIIQNWQCFSDLIPSQHWLKQRFDELEKARNFIAHNRLLMDNEFERIEMYISDWNKQVGF